MNTLRLRIVVSGDQYDVGPFTRKPGESNNDLGTRALFVAYQFVKENQLGDFESITPLWSNE